MFYARFLAIKFDMRYANNVALFIGIIMKIKINGKIYDIEDAKHLEIEFNDDLDGLSVGSHDNSSVTIINGRVIQQSGSFLEPRSIEVKIAGNVNSARTVSGNVYIMGYAGSAQTTSGDINANEGISGNVQTVSGDVKASGSINGGVSTVSGDIRGAK